MVYTRTKRIINRAITKRDVEQLIAITQRQLETMGRLHTALSDSISAFNAFIIAWDKLGRDAEREFKKRVQVDRERVARTRKRTRR